MEKCSTLTQHMPVLLPKVTTDMKLLALKTLKYVCLKKLPLRAVERWHWSWMSGTRPEICKTIFQAMPRPASYHFWTIIRASQMKILLQFHVLERILNPIHRERKRQECFLAFTEKKILKTSIRGELENGGLFLYGLLHHHYDRTNEDNGWGFLYTGIHAYSIEQLCRTCFLYGTILSWRKPNKFFMVCVRCLYKNYKQIGVEIRKILNTAITTPLSLP